MEAERKKRYNQHREMAEKLLNGYTKFVDELDKQHNLKQISLLEFQASIIDYEDQLFYYEYEVWEYEFLEAKREFKAARKDFAAFDKAAVIIEEINSAKPKKKVNYKKSELISKTQRQVAEITYSNFLSVCKRVPVHLSDKRKFPLVDINKYPK